MRAILKICLLFWFALIPFQLSAQTAITGDDASVEASSAEPANKIDFDQRLQVWDRTAEQTEMLLESQDATNLQLRNFRKALDINRNEANKYISETEAQLRDLESQLEALSPAPIPAGPDGEAKDNEADVPQSEELKKRKSEVEVKLSEVQGNVLSANQIIKEANGLIEQIDTRMRENFYNALLTRSQSPISLDSIRLSIYGFVEVFRTVGGEIQTNYASLKGTSLISERWVTVAFLIIFGSLILYFSPKFAWMQLGRNAPWPVRWQRVLMPLAPTFVALIALPVGVRLIEVGLEFSGLFGAQGEVLLGCIRDIIFFLFAARWLKWLIYQVDGHEDVIHYKFSSITYVLAFCLGLAWTLPRIMRISGIDIAAASTINFAIIFIGTLCAWYFTSRRHYSMLFGIRRVKTVPKLKRILSMALRYSATFTLFLSIIGYFAASYQLFRGAFFTSYIIFLGIHLAHFLNQWIASCLREFNLTDENSTSDEIEDKLWPILIQLIIWAASIPAVLISWGVPNATLLELWNRLKQGIALGDVHISMPEIFKFILAFYFGYLLVGAIKKAMERSILTRTSLDLGARSAIVAMIGYVGYTLVALVAMSVAGIDLSAIGYIAGALSVGIGFGLQNIVQNFISGLILLVERPVKKGDWIKVGDSEGYVQNIAVRSTAIRTFDDSTIIVPNADLISNPVTNWFHDDQSARVTVYVGVAYDSDPQKVSDILLELVNQSSYRRRDPNASVIIRELGDSSIHFELRFWINDADWITRARSEIYFAILDRFKQEGIGIPYPQRDLHIVSGKMS